MAQENTERILAGWLVAHHAAMLRLAGLFADAVHAPEDIVSRARTVALDRHAEVVGVDSPLGWLLAITKSVGLQVVRKRDRRAGLRAAGSLEGSGLYQSPDEDVSREWWLARLPDPRREQVLEIARGLSGALRELVYRTLIDGWDDREIANHHGITESAVRRRRKRAVEAILEKLPPPPPRLPGMIPRNSPACVCSRATKRCAGVNRKAPGDGRDAIGSVWLGRLAAASRRGFRPGRANGGRDGPSRQCHGSAISRHLISREWRDSSPTAGRQERT